MYPCHWYNVHLLYVDHKSRIYAAQAQAAL